MLCAVLATLVLLLRIRRRSEGIRLDFTDLVALLLTVLIFVRQTMLQDYSKLTSLLQPLWYACLWGPLLIALRRVDEKTIIRLREMIIFFAFVIGVVGTLAYLSGSSRLLDMAQYGKADDWTAGHASAKERMNDIVASRYLVIGVYTFLPYAYWLVLYNMFGSARQSPLRTMYYTVTLCGMWICFGTSLSRSIALVFGMGTVIIVGYSLLKQRLLSLAGLRRFGPTLLIILLIFGAAAPVANVGGVLENLNGRLATIGKNDPTTLSRFDDSSKLWTYLLKVPTLFGDPGPDPVANYGHDLGDPNLPLYVWLYYGIGGLLLFLILFLPQLLRVGLAWIRTNRPRHDPAFLACMSGWALFYVCQLGFLGNYLQSSDVFFMTFFLAATGRFWETQQFTSVPRGCGYAVAPKLVRLRRSGVLGRAAGLRITPVGHRRAARRLPRPIVRKQPRMYRFLSNRSVPIVKQRKSESVSNS